MMPRSLTEEVGKLRALVEQASSRTSPQPRATPSAVRKRVPASVMPAFLSTMVAPKGASSDLMSSAGVVGARPDTLMVLDLCTPT